jgi:preprotein translocase subunit SecA
MFKNILTRIVGSDSDKALARLAPLVEKCTALEPALQALSDDALRGKTAEFKQRLADGESLDALMPEAFAVMREASRRINGMRHYDVQLVGSALLHQGKIAELGTGEGKTLVATAPIYLNALTGRGAHLVTQNDYLARRDAQWMGRVYHFLGMRIAVLQAGAGGRPDDSTFEFDPDYQSKSDNYLNLRPITRAEAYRCDITYGTSSEFGFDYLRDNMNQDLAECVQRVDNDGLPILSYAIIDEVDNLLIDEARTPLIISGPADEPSNLYKRFAELVRKLSPSQRNDFKNPDGDFLTEAKTKNVTLTEEGIIKIEKMLGIDNLYAPEHASMTPYLDNALRAHVIYERDRDYVIENGEIVIVDEFTGRLMYGRRFSEGLHQAIEAKEGVKVQRESFTYATITIQNFFRMYEKLAGMTGTAMTESEEFFKIYNLEVVPLPTNVAFQVQQKKLVEKKESFVDGSPVQVFIDPKTERKYFKRLNYADVVYKNAKSKFDAVVEEIAETNKTGRPVLVGTISIEASEYISKLLTRKGIRYQVLNARPENVTREAEIIAQAGRLGAVTIATNMAGRGVDILLGGNPEGIARDRLRKAGVDLTALPREDFLKAVADADVECSAEKKKVVELGGLHVIGTERHEARRIDNQLRGRCSRQGDPGSARFFVSLEDDLMRRFGGDRVKGLMERLKMEEDVPLEFGILSQSIETAQEKVEGYNFDVRKHVIQYDDVINKQREVIYAQRRKILEQPDLKDVVMDMVDDELEGLVKEHTQGDLPENWDLLGLLNEVRPIVPLPRDFDIKQWERGTRDEITESLSALAEQRYTTGLPELARLVQQQMTLAAYTLETLKHSTRDALARAVHTWAKKHMGDDVVERYETTPFNAIPEEHQPALNKAFDDGIRLWRDRTVLIQTVDDLWIKHLTDLDELREGIGLRAYAQRDPLVAYRTEASNVYGDMLANLKQAVAQKVFNLQFSLTGPGTQQPPSQGKPSQPSGNGSGGGSAPRPPAGGGRTTVDRAIDRAQMRTSGGGSVAPAKAKPAAAAKIGRNDVCPFCDSGKKVKVCDCVGAKKWRGLL